MNKEQKLFFSIVFIFIVFCFWNSIFFINSNVILLLFLTFFTVILAAWRNLISEKLKKLLYYSFFVSICLLFANWISSYSVYINKTFLPDTVEIGLVFWTILSWISLLKNTNFDTKTSNINKKFFLIILIFICSISIALRLWNLWHLGIVNDEGYTTFYSYLINQNRIPCDINTKICYLRWVPYHYLVSLFTLFLGTNEFTVRLPNIVIFIWILFYLYKILNIFKADKKLILLIFGLICFADFGFGLVNLARFYTLWLFFFLTTLYYYYSIFIIKQSKNYFFMIVSIVLGILTFEFNVVFIYFLIDPLLNKNFSLYKNKKFLKIGRASCRERV